MGRFRPDLVERKIKALSKKGLVVTKKKSGNDGSWYYKIQKQEDSDTDKGTGIGYNAKEDYFFHNTHGKNDMEPGNIWAHDCGHRGPAGYHTFDQKYVEDRIKYLRKK